LQPFIHAKQQAAERFAAAFVPQTRFGVFLRNQVIKTFRVPAIAKTAAVAPCSSRGQALDPRVQQG